MTPNEFNLSELPALPITHCDSLPDIPAIYFAISNGEVLYVGKAKSLHSRWKAHHRRNQLRQWHTDVELAWLCVSDETLLDEIEAAMITNFAPQLNGTPIERTPRDSPVKWKLKEFLEREGVTAYSLADKTHGKLSQNGVYRLTSSDLKGLRFESLEAILPALTELTGRRVELSDLIEFKYGDEAN